MGDAAVIDALNNMQLCLKRFCKKEYKGTEQELIACKLKQCKSQAIKLRDALLKDAMKDVKIHKALLKKEKDPKKQKFYQDILQYNQTKIQELKKEF